MDTAPRQKYQIEDREPELEHAETGEDGWQVGLARMERHIVVVVVVVVVVVIVMVLVVLVVVVDVWG